jgi:hypothetical protein
MKNNKATSNNVGLFTGLLSAIVLAMPPSFLHAVELVEKTITIYSDSFEGTGTFAGSSPVISSEAPTWAQGATWKASTSLTYNTDGGYIEALSGTRTAFLPVKITENSGIYTFTLTYSLQGSSQWVLAAFSNRSHATNATDSDILGENVISGLYGPGGVITAYNGFGTIANGDAGTGSTSGTTPLTLSIAIDTYKATDNLTLTVISPGSGSLTATLTKDSYEKIQTLRIGNNSTEGRFYDMALTLTTLTAAPAVPEPETFAALLGVFILLGVVGMKLRR